MNNNPIIIIDQINDTNKSINNDTELVSIGSRKIPNFKQK